MRPHILPSKSEEECGQNEIEKVMIDLKYGLNKQEPYKVEGTGRYRDLAAAFLQGKRLVPKRKTDSEYKEYEYPSIFYYELKRDGSIDDSGIITEQGKREVALRYFIGHVNFDGPPGKIIIMGDENENIIIPECVKAVIGEMVTLKPTGFGNTHSFIEVEDPYIQKIIDLFGVSYPKRGHIVSADTIEFKGDCKKIKELNHYGENVMQTTTRDEYGFKIPVMIRRKVRSKTIYLETEVEGTCEICGKEIGILLRDFLDTSSIGLGEYYEVPLIRKL